MGTSGGYVAVGQKGNFLFWKRTEKVAVMVEDPSPTASPGAMVQAKDENGNPKFDDRFVSYEPC